MSNLRGSDGDADRDHVLLGPVKKVYLGVLFWCTSEKGVLILTLNGEKGVLFLLPK